MMGCAGKQPDHISHAVAGHLCRAAWIQSGLLCAICDRQVTPESGGGAKPLCQLRRVAVTAAHSAADVQTAVAALADAMARVGPAPEPESAR